MKTNLYTCLNVQNGVPVKAWVKGVPFDEKAKAQLINTAKMPFIFKWVAAMPDVHMGLGATIGSVIPTKGAIIPAAVGVDIGCGMMAVQTSLKAEQLPDNLAGVRSVLEKAVPHGRTSSGRKGSDRGAWYNLPKLVENHWARLESGFKSIIEKHPKIADSNNVNHLGTLGTGNHFLEMCLDESDQVWLMLHSGSRGVGNRIGSHFIAMAKKEMEKHFISVPDKDLSYFPEGTEHFHDYVEAVCWAQDFAKTNRQIMMDHSIQALQSCGLLPTFTIEAQAVNCHHNYAARETHYGEEVWVTRKGAVRAGKDELGIIPGSMGARSFIVRGLGNPESFMSCSHGAGRLMSRTQAKKQFTIEDHIKATAGCECRKDAGVLDETPGAYKPIEAVIKAQEDLVQVVHTLKQVVCVKG